MNDAKELLELAETLKINTFRLQKANMLPKKRNEDGSESDELENEKFEAARKEIIEDTYRCCGTISSLATQGFLSASDEKLRTNEVSDAFVADYENLTKAAMEGDLRPFALRIIEIRKEFRKIYQECNGFENIRYREAFDAIEDVLLGNY